MEIYVIRHFEAVDSRDSSMTDEERHLSPEGREVGLQMARRLKKSGLDLILTSPLVRAVQTAEIVARHQSRTVRVESLPSLAPGYSTERLLGDLSHVPRTGRIALVGHEPGLGHLVGRLLQRSPVPLRKGAACRIHIPDRTGETKGPPGPLVGEFVWMKVPGQARMTSLELA